MALKIKRIDRLFERNIITGMIVSRSYLAQIRSSFNFDYLKNSYAKTIAKWCIDHFDKYDDCPFEKIQDIFEYQDKRGDIEGDEIDLIETLLEDINEDFSKGDELNTPFLLDKTEEYFNRVRLENLVKEINYELEEGTVGAADDAVAGSKEVRVTSNHAIDPLSSEEKTRAAFDNVSEPLFTVAGDLGEMINEQLCRDSFLAIQAPEKTGKTWMLYWLAREALKNRLKVVIFQIGDMTEDQSIVRMAISNSGKSNKKQYCGKFLYPNRFVTTTKEENEKRCPSAPIGYDLEMTEMTIEEPLCWRQAHKANEKFYKSNRIKKDKYLRLITTPASSINMKQIDAELDKLQNSDDFVADVVVVDYMDILAAEDGRDIGRDKINNNWIQAKALCNRRHILLLSATQASAEAYNGETQERTSFSEDKRKYSHVNGMLGLSQSYEQKRDGIIKLNWLMVREGDFATDRPCFVAQSLRRGRPVCASLLPDFVRKDGERPAEKVPVEVAAPNKGRGRKLGKRRGRV